MTVGVERDEADLLGAEPAEAAYLAPSLVPGEHAARVFGAEFLPAAVFVVEVALAVADAVAHHR